MRLRDRASDDELARALGAPAGPRERGLAGAEVPAGRLAPPQALRYALDVVALKLWTQALAAAQRDHPCLPAARDRVGREEGWLERAARGSDPAWEAVRGRLARLAVVRSQERDAAERRLKELAQAAAPDPAQEAAAAIVARARAAHELATYAALTARVPNSRLKAMQMGTGDGKLRQLRTSGGAMLAPHVELLPTLEADPPTPATAPPSPTPATQPPHARRGAALVAAAGIAALTGAVILIPALRGSGETSAATCPAGIHEPDPRDRRAARAPRPDGSTRTLPPVFVGIKPTALTVAREGVWVAQRQGVGLVDPGRRVMAMPLIPVTDDPPSKLNGAYAIAPARDRLWVTRRDGHLVSIDRSTREVVDRPIRYGSGPAAVALAGGAVWVNNYGDAWEGSVTRIDPCTGDLRRIKVGRGANTVYAANGSLWITNPVDGALERLDPRTGRKLVSVTGLDDPQDVVAAEGLLWVTQYTSATVQAVDPATDEKVGDPIPVGADPAGIGASAGTVWVVSYGNGTLTAIDARSRRSVRRAARAGVSPTDVVAGFGLLWAPNNDGDTVTPVRP